jgi:hypothetical protein
MGVFSSQPDPPTYYHAVDTSDCVRYTAVAQAQWFMDRIQYAYAGSTTNARLDPDGSTIRWFGSYTLALGDWLYAGKTAMTDAVLRDSAFRPNLSAWPV